MMQASELKGAMTAIVTPFKDGRVDRNALESLVDDQIKGGTSAIVPCGTTGESATLSFDEHEEVIDIVIQRARGKVGVIAGTGSNNTAEAVKLTCHAEKAGADACLLITPYYNKPTPAGLVAHFKRIAEQSKLPLVLYNIASRTGINMTPELIAEISQISTVIGVKEASGNLEQVSRIIALCGDNFAVVSGDDDLTLPILSVGGRGVISVASNVVPGPVSEMIKLFLTGKHAEATAIHHRLAPLVRALFLETNPIPVKEALGLMKKIQPELRLPLVSMSQANHEKLRAALKVFGLI